MAVRYNKAPFPWFGGKSQAAPLVWSLLGDPEHYVEPFVGSMAVLLERSHPANRVYFSETVNDLDGFLVNAWRGIQLQPAATAAAASWPVTEADKIARQLACQRWKRDHDLERLMGDPSYCDPVIAGWWLYGVCCQIGAIGGPWVADPVTGRLVKQTGGGSRNRPHLGNNGRGVNHAGTREPGVSLTEGEPGEWAPAQEFHPVTLPELGRWFAWLSARLRNVRVVNGSWERVCTSGALQTLSVRQGKGVAGVFLDPPYDDAVRSAGLYDAGCDSGAVAAEVRRWCVAHGADPALRVVLAGFDVEHAELRACGWQEYLWFKGGFLRGGYANQGGATQQHRERLWASPHCHAPQRARQRTLFSQPEEKDDDNGNGPDAGVV